MVKIPLPPALNPVLGHIVVKIPLWPALNPVLGYIVVKSGRKTRKIAGWVDPRFLRVFNG